MAPYCDYCNRRCFVQRVLKDTRSMLLATCTGGMTRDFELLGEDHRSAVNPVSGRPGYDTPDYRDAAKEIVRCARYLGWGETAVPAHEYVARITWLVQDLRRQTPSPGVPVQPLGPAI